MAKEWSLRILQISDMHVFADINKQLLSVNTQESFQAVVDFISHKNKKEKIDLIILSGDLSQDGSLESYERVANMLKHLQVPIYCIPGNHDNVTNMMATYADKSVISCDRHILFKDWQFILLDSAIPGKVEGHLDQSQLDYLQEKLRAYPQHHSIIVFHHHPFKVHSKWIDNIGVNNADEFWKILASYSNVVTVLFSHVHQEVQQVFNGIPCYSTPSTCFQFKCNHDEFALDEFPPGYRWIKLYGNGKLETGVERLAHYVGNFDAAAKGY